MSVTTRVALLAALVSVLALAAAAQATNFSAWGNAQKIDEIAGNSSELNTPFHGRLPDPVPGRAQPLHGLEPPGGQRPASTSGSPTGRARTSRGARPRTSVQPINSAADDFCPTPVQGGGLFFVSRRGASGELRAGRHLLHALQPAPRLVGATQPGLRPRRAEHRARRAGPVVRRERRRRLSVLLVAARAAVPGDIYVSRGSTAGTSGLVAGRRAQRRGGERHPAERPQGRARGRLLVEPRRRARRPGHLGLRRATSFDAPWSAPVNLGAAVNTAAAETRPSLSKNARQLLFGRAPGPEGIGDIYVSTRSKANGD